MDKKQSFILYADIREPLSDLTDEQIGKLFRAILDYVADGKEPRFKGAMAMAFSFVRSALDRDAIKYQRKVERRRAAGRVGGIASGESRRSSSDETENEANEANEANASFASPGSKRSKPKQTKQTEANEADPDPDPDPVPGPVPVPDPDINTQLSKSSTYQEGTHSNNTSAELFQNSSPLQLRLADGSSFLIQQKDVDVWKRTFPGVNVDQELREMALWCEDNPKKRKTRQGIRRFIAGWLGKAQDRASSNTPIDDDEDPVEAMDRAVDEIRQMFQRKEGSA